MDLSGMDLTGINLQGANLVGTNFASATLDKANLRNSDAWCADFQGTGMNYSDVSYAYFSKWSVSQCASNMNGVVLHTATMIHVFMSHVLGNGADFSRAVMTNADLAHAKLQFSTFRDADVTNAYFWNTNLTQADFDFAVLENSDMPYVIIDNATFGSADMTNVQLSVSSGNNADFSGAEMTNALITGNLQGATFSGMYAPGVKITQAHLQGAVFANSNLQNSWIVNNDLSDATFYGADLSESEITSASQPQHWYNWTNFENTTFYQATLIGSSLIGNFKNASFAYADMEDSFISGNWTDSNLLRADLRHATFSLVDLSGATLEDTDLSFAFLSNNVNITNGDGSLATWFGYSYWYQTEWIDGTRCNENPVHWGNDPSARTCDANGTAIDV